jgi:hypothetical protein
VYIRRQSWLEEQRERWLNPSDALPQPSSVGIIKGPEILGAGADEAPVLQALLDDPSRKVRLFAQIGLGMDPPIPGDD